MKKALLIIIAVLFLAGCSGTSAVGERKDPSAPRIENPNSKPDAFDDYTAKELYELGYLYPDTLTFLADDSDAERHLFSGEGDSVRELIVEHGILAEDERVSAPLLAAGFEAREIVGTKEITGSVWVMAKSSEGGIETRGYATALGDDYYLVKYSFPSDGELAKAQASGIEYALFMREIYE